MENPKPRVAVIFTEFTYRSHTHVLLENFLRPSLFRGRRMDPSVEIVSMWGDQYPAGSMAADAAREFGIYLAPTIRDALLRGGATLAVDAVLLIAEQGEYPYNALGQKLYPRKQFFDQIVAVLRETGGAVPIFCDKHLSYRWDWAREMYDTAAALGCPLMAGSSVPLAWRRPSPALPRRPVFDEALLVHCGGWGPGADAYDFHGLEALQSVVESRRGGETGVESVQCFVGDGLGRAAAEGLWNPALADVALRPELGERAGTWREFAPDATLVVVRYRDGFVAPMLAVHGNRWAFAYRLHGRSAPEGFEFNVGPWMNRNLFKALAHAIARFFRSGVAPIPIERTLLTTALTEAVAQARHRPGERISTPHAAISYRPRDFAAYCENGASWKILTDSVPEPRGIDPLGGIALPGSKPSQRPARFQP